GEDAVDARADHFEEGVLDEVGIAGVVEDVGEGLGESEALIELPEGEQAGIAGELSGGGFDEEGQVAEIEGGLPGRLYTHGRSPWCVEHLPVQQVRRSRRPSIPDAGE